MVPGRACGELIRALRAGDNFDIFAFDFYLLLLLLVLQSELTGLSIKASH